MCRSKIGGKHSNYGQHLVRQFKAMRTSRMPRNVAFQKISPMIGGYGPGVQSLLFAFWVGITSQTALMLIVFTATEVLLPGPTKISRSKISESPKRAKLLFRAQLLRQERRLSYSSTNLGSSRGRCRRRYQHMSGLNRESAY